MSKLRTLVVALAIAAASIAPSQMVRWAQNGHFYEFVPTWLTWLNAQTEAESRSFLGVDGTLMTVTSAGEQNFIVSTFGEPLREASLGGYKEGGKWHWVTGEAWNYTNWAPGEPNSSDFLAFHGGNFLGSWNDRPSSDMRHYFVEYPVKLLDTLTTSYTVTRGIPTGGTIFEILVSDNTYLMMQSVYSFTRSMPSIQVEFTGNAPVGEVSVVGVVLESAVSTINVLERIEMFDYVANQWVALGERYPGLSDSEVIKATTQAPDRFVHPTTREIRARVSWFDRGTPSRNWLCRVDKVNPAITVD